MHRRGEIAWSVKATAASADRGVPFLAEGDLLLLEQLSYGLTDEMIGSEMHLSVGAVRENIRGVLRELGATNREHAVAIALKTGLIR